MLKTKRYCYSTTNLTAVKSERNDKSFNREEKNKAYIIIHKIKLYDNIIPDENNNIVAGMYLSEKRKRQYDQNIIMIHNDLLCVLSFF